MLSGTAGHKREDDSKASTHETNINKIYTVMIHDNLLIFIQNQGNAFYLFTIFHYLLILKHISRKNST